MASIRSTLRQRQTEATRQLLLDTALALFSKKGYAKVTVDDICRKAGVSKGTFYNHFESKDRIILETFRQADEFYQDAYDRTAHLNDPLERMKAFGRAIWEYMRDMGRDNLRVAYQSQIGADQVQSSIAMENRPLYKLIEVLVLEGQKQGLARTDLDARTITRILVRAYRGIVYEWCLRQEEFDLIAAGDEMFEVLFKGLSHRKGD